MQNQFRMLFALASLLFGAHSWAQDSWDCQQECSPKSPFMLSAEQAPQAVVDQKNCINQCEEKIRQEEVESSADDERNNLDRFEEEE